MHPILFVMLDASTLLINVLQQLQQMDVNVLMEWLYMIVKISVSIQNNVHVCCNALYYLWELAIMVDCIV